MKTKKIIIPGVVVAAVLAVGWVLWHARSVSEDGSETPGSKVEERGNVQSPSSRKPRVKPPVSEQDSRNGISRVAESVDTPAEEAPQAPQTEDERREAEEEARVETFDALTDKWMEKREVTMNSIEEFVSTFRRVPKARQDECIHRALNLVPDENVMLLAGVLMDKSMDKEVVETVFNDILNRDEDVKKPILKTVFKDKTHPCWADTAWILDVTGELNTQK